MSEAALADLSRTLFAPVTILVYVAAMLAYLYAMAFTRVARDPDETAIAGTRALHLATGLAVLGLATHLGHLVTRSLAAGGRVPWGTMFEYSSVMGFGVVLAGVLIFQWRLRRPEVVGFLILGALLTMGTALLVYTEPGPLQPILNSQWLKIHVLAIMLAATVFTVGFVFNALHLLRDTAERRVAERYDSGMFSGSTVGAARASAVTPATEADEDPLAEDPVLERGYPEDLAEGGVSAGGDDDAAAYGHELRRALAEEFRVGGRTILFPVRIAAWAAGTATLFSLVFQRPSATVAMPVVAIVSVWLAWRFVPSLPSAATLDSLAYRTIAFGFPLWTFAVLAGAVWAEQSWGRYWGWDPKETSAFLTWIAYAGYLHARATRGMRGRRAAWFGMGAYAVLLFTYYVVNLLVVGLHSYAT